MNLLIFLAHFAFIGGIFAGGMAVGYRYKNKLETFLNKYFKRNA